MQAWRVPHPPTRGHKLMGTRPLVHVGFMKSWLAGGFNLKVINRVMQLISARQDASAEVKVYVTGTNCHFVLLLLMYVFVCLFIHLLPLTNLCIYLLIYLLIYLFIHFFLFASFHYLFIYLFVYLFIHLLLSIAYILVKLHVSMCCMGLELLSTLMFMAWVGFLLQCCPSCTGIYVYVARMQKQTETKHH